MLKRFAFGLIILLPLFPLILLAGSPVIKQPVPIKNIAGIKPTCGKKVCITVESTENLKKDFPKLSLEGKPIAIMVGPNKKPQRFIPDQIIFKPRDLAHLKTFLKRTNAKILHDGTLALPPQRAGLNNPKIRPKKSGYYLLKIPAFTRPNSKEFAKLMESQLKSANGTYRLNQEGLALTHFILKETARGEKVSPNVIIDSAAQPDVMSFTEEELVDDLFLDAFDFPGVGTPYGVNLQKAWQYIDLLQPSAATANPNTEERDTMVKVAFIDEGFRAVPDLISTDLTLDGWDSECSTWDNGPWYYSHEPVCTEWNVDYSVINEPIISAVNSSTCLNDICWHGFNVESVAASRINNSVGIAGTGGQVIYPILMQRGNLITRRPTTYEDAWLVLSATMPEWGTQIINMSFGMIDDGSETFDYNIDPLREAVGAAVDAGVIVVAAAGNESVSLDLHASTVCGVDGIICVGAGDTARWVVRGVFRSVELPAGGGVGVECVAPDPEGPATLTDCDRAGSNWGGNVDIWAPVPLKTLNAPKCDTDYPCSTPEEIEARPINVSSGSATSHATPYITGVIAMMKALKPSLTADEARMILRDTATPSDDPLVTPGYVNPYKAIQHVMELQGLTLPDDGNDTPEESIATSIGLAPESSALGSIIPGGDEDFYTFTFPDTYSSLRIELLAGNHEINGPFYAHLYTDGYLLGEPFFSLTPYPGGSYDASLVPPRQRYDVKIKGLDDTFGNYRLRFIRSNGAVSPDRYDDQSPTGEARNDRREDAARLGIDSGGEITREDLISPFGARVMDLNFDRAAGGTSPYPADPEDLDIDYFILELPSEVPTGQFGILGTDCLSDDALTSMEAEIEGLRGRDMDLNYSPGYLQVYAEPYHYLDHDWPESIHIELFNGDTWAPLELESIPPIDFGLPGYDTREEGTDITLTGPPVLTCPRQKVPSGRIGIKVTSTGTAEPRNFYNLTLKYRGWGIYPVEHRNPLPPLELLLDISRLLALFKDFDLTGGNSEKWFSFQYPKILDKCANTACPDPLPDYFVISLQNELRDFIFEVMTDSTCHLNTRFLDNQKSPIHAREKMEIRKDGRRETKGFQIDRLTKGKYLIEIDGSSPCPYQIRMGNKRRQKG